jgi:hypothetical protein
VGQRAYPESLARRGERVLGLVPMQPGRRVAFEVDTLTRPEHRGLGLLEKA